MKLRNLSFMSDFNISITTVKDSLKCHRALDQELRDRHSSVLSETKQLIEDEKRDLRGLKSLC